MTVARCIHPKRFEDLDPQATLAEINRLFKVGFEGSHWIDAK